MGREQEPPIIPQEVHRDSSDQGFPEYNLCADGIQRRIEALSQLAHGGIQGEGGGRLAFTPEEFAARRLLAAWVDQIVVEKDRLTGQETEKREWADASGHHTEYRQHDIVVHQYPTSVIVEWVPTGVDPLKPSAAIGSHIDAVMGGGREDGQGGIAVVFEIFRILFLNNIPLNFPLHLVFPTGEESKKFSFLGITGLLEGFTPAELKTKLECGLTLEEALNRTAREFGIKEFTPASLSEPPIKKPWLLHLEPHAWPQKDLGDKRLGVAEAVIGSQTIAVTTFDLEFPPVPPNYLLDRWQLTTNGTPGLPAAIPPVS